MRGPANNTTEEREDTSGNGQAAKLGGGGSEFSGARGYKFGLG